MEEIILRTPRTNEELFAILRNCLPEGQSLNTVESEGFDNAAGLTSIVVPITTAVIYVLREYFRAWSKIRVVELESSRDVKLAQLRTNVLLHWRQSTVSLATASPDDLDALLTKLEAAIEGGRQAAQLPSQHDVP